MAGTFSGSGGGWESEGRVTLNNKKCVVFLLDQCLTL